MIGIRLVGTRGDVIAAIGLLRETFDVSRVSDTYPGRDGLVNVFVRADLPAPAAPPDPATVEGDPDDRT